MDMYMYKLADALDYLQQSLKIYENVSFDTCRVT